MISLYNNYYNIFDLWGNNMTYEEAKTLLVNYSYDAFFYDEKNQELNTTRKKLDILLPKNITNSIVFEEMRKSVSDMLEKQHVDEKVLFDLFNQKCDLEARISKLKQPYKNVLYLRYIKAYRYEIIADKMSYSVKRIYQLHNDAIKMFAELDEQNGTVS